MVEWMKIQDMNGDTYLVNVADIAYISKDGIAFRSCGVLWIPMDVEEVDRVIAETRKTGERIDGEGAVRELTNAEIVRWIESD